jgi:hypothetical protein
VRVRGKEGKRSLARQYARFSLLKPLSIKKVRKEKGDQ